ncbi:hypothetical protein LCGC14_0625560, partial [marine sediment metagenome]
MNRAEKEIDESEKIFRDIEYELKLKNEISHIFLTSSDDKLYGEVLSVLLKALQSKFGTFGYFDEQENLVQPSLTREIWDQCEMDQKDIIFPKNVWFKGIWGRVVRENKSILVNNQFKVPEGHVQVENFLGSPISFHNNVIGVVSLANKNADYTTNDITMLESMVEYISPILYARRERDKLEKKQKESKKQLKIAFDQVSLFKDFLTHDINNIFNNIRSSVELCKIFSSGFKNMDNVNEQYDIMNGQINRGVKLISNARKLSQSDELLKQKKSINLCTYLKEAIDFVQKSFQDRELNITVNSRGEKTFVYANEFLLDVFENLLINGILHNMNSIIDIFVNITEVFEDSQIYIKIEFKD